MCLILFAWHTILTTRSFLRECDALYSRPTAPAGFWDDHPQSSQDAIGIAGLGRYPSKWTVAAVTNYGRRIEAWHTFTGSWSAVSTSDLAPEEYLQEVRRQRTARRFQSAGWHGWPAPYSNHGNNKWTSVPDSATL
jgi:hypothetical protein